MLKLFGATTKYLLQSLLSVTQGADERQTFVKSRLSVTQVLDE